MELIALLGLILGSSWTAGINLYLTVAGLGLAHRLNWIVLPGHLEILSHPLVIFATVLLYLIEFFADKIPYVDSAWDAIHTAIRPLGGAIIAYLATADSGALAQAASTFTGGMIALDAHATKAGSRALINTSPEPITNSVASVAEDSIVLGSLWLIIHHPWAMILIVFLFIVLSIWLLPKIMRAFAKVFTYLFKRPAHKEKESAPSSGIPPS